MKESYVPVGGEDRLWVCTSGTGDPMIFLNGGPGMADYLGPVADLLSDSLRVIRFEQRGCGRSISTGPMTVQQFVEDIVTLKSEFGIDRWWVTGHSWGADLGLAYVLVHPDHVKGLIGIAGGRIHRDDEWKRIYTENKDKEALPPSDFEPNYDVNTALINSWYEYCRQPTLYRRLAELHTPCLFIDGEHDIRPTWPTEQLANLLPDARYVVLSDADHNVWQGNSAALKAEIVRFCGV